MCNLKLYSRCIVLCILCWVVTGLQAGPANTKFEQERKNVLQRIKTIKKILNETESKHKVSIGQLKALEKQIENNQLLIQSLNCEIVDINQQLDQQFHKVSVLETELAQLKKEYASMAYLGAKTMYDVNMLVFIFSAHSFQELLERIHAIKQYTKLRRRHFQEIQHLKATLENQQETLAGQVLEKHQLLGQWRKEQHRLTDLQKQQIEVVNQLEQQRVRLIKELAERNQAVQRLDKLITDYVKKEMQRAKEIAQQKEQEKKETTQKTDTIKKPLKPTLAKLTTNFMQNRGKMPWPVKKGFISSKFGIQSHAILKNIQVENLGIDIQTQANSKVHAIFDGVVKTIAFVPGMNQVVIIQHGLYHTVYAKLKSTLVKVGQYVQQQEAIGVVYTNKQGITELQLQIWKETQKLNPAGWITKQPNGD